MKLKQLYNDIGNILKHYDYDVFNDRKGLRLVGEGKTKYIILENEAKAKTL